MGLVKFIFKFFISIGLWGWWIVLGVWLVGAAISMHFGSFIGLVSMGGSIYGVYRVNKWLWKL